MRKYSWILLLLSFAAQAQQSALDETFYSEGKIYVVIAVLAIIFIGIALYLVRLDRKIKKLENNEA